MIKYNNELNLLVFIFLSIFVMLKFAKYINLIDKKNYRKKHKIDAALIGGIIFSLSFSYILFLDNFNKTLNYVIIGSILISIVGFIDDKYTLQPLNKIILQLFPILYLLNQGLVLNSLGNFNVIENLNLGSFSIIFSLLAVFLLVNSANYLDGKDGNLLTLFITVNLIFKFLYFDNSEILRITNYMILISIILLMFNLINIQKYKIFLGDSGSLFIGFYLSFFLIYCANTTDIHPIILASTITIFIYDFIAVSLERFYLRQKVFKPDNNHIHHLLNTKLKSNLLSLLSVNICNLLFFVVNYYIFIFNNLFALINYFIMFFIYLYMRHFLRG